MPKPPLTALLALTLAACGPSGTATSDTWTEFGPEHSQADIETVCAAGAGGEAKSVTWTGYFEEQHGVLDPYYLRIKRAE